jgi:hypothetical protein
MEECPPLPFGDHDKVFFIIAIISSSSRTTSERKRYTYPTLGKGNPLVQSKEEELLAAGSRGIQSMWSLCGKQGK